MDYEQFKIREFGFWLLYLHKSQVPYLGRSYAWAKRPEADKVSDMTPDEMRELFQKVIPSWERGVARFHDNFRPNVAILGNTSPHLHAHLIPRFEKPVIYMGLKFIDPNPKGNYSPYSSVDLSLETLLRVRDDMREGMS